MSATISAVEDPVTLETSELVQTIEQNPTSTIEPPRARSSAAGRRALEALTPNDAVIAGLDVGVTIGEGGMAVVRTATQRSLGRRVAVKTLKSDVRTDEAKLRLLREAWVTGALEHPNIVPVYDLGLDADGTPVILLKQIEGLPWSAMIDDAAYVETRFPSGDLLDYNLRVLIQLCHAVSLAHARGIIHRDLKPENVMIGSFGDVYLVDWGLAVSLTDDATGRLPLASEANAMAGTPAYMAPEMLGELGPLGVRTDVYLLGAILFEVLARRPPHAHDRFPDIIESIRRSEPSFPDDSPAELIAIAKRAMSPHPEGRFASVVELRERLEWYLRHRGSLSLSAEAALRAEELGKVVKEGGDPADVRDRVHRLFAEVKFGFRQAIRACEDNETAKKGLRDVTETVVLFELERGNPEGAAAALAELGSPTASLARRVADAIRARDVERLRVGELEKLRADFDPSIGRRTRVAVVLMLTLGWAVLPEGLGWLVARYPNPPHWLPYLHTFNIVWSGAIVCWWGRDMLARTALNRRSQATIAMMLAMQLTLEVGSHLLGIPFRTMLVLHIFNWTTATAAFSVLVDRRFAISTLGVVGIFIAACSWPAQVWHLMTASSLLFAANAVVVWSRPTEDADYLVERWRSRIRRPRHPT